MSGSEYIRSVRIGLGQGLLLLPAVAVVVRDPGDRVLLVQAVAGSRWGLPAGGIEPGEPPLVAARRELAEETGLRAIELRLLGCCGGENFRHRYPNGDRVEYSIFVFGGSVADGFEPQPSDLDEVRSARFFARADAPRLSMPYPERLVWEAPLRAPA